MLVICACGADLEISHVKLDGDYDSEINVLVCPDCAAEYQEVIDAREDTINDLEQKDADSWEKRQQLKGENDELTVALSFANDDISGLRTELDDLEQELQAIREKIKELSQ